MIVSLTIKNFIIIRNVEVVFDKGFNILTGMTGGGKSLILKALDFLMGARSSKDLIAFDAFTDDDYELAGDTVKLTVPTKSYRLVRVEEK